MAANSHPTTDVSAPIGAALAAAFIAAPTIGISLAECLFWDLHRFVLIYTSIPAYLVWLPVLLSALVVGLLSAPALSYGKDGILSLLAGYSLAGFVIFHTRGSYIWPGLFDESTRSPYRLVLMLGFSGLVALIASLLFQDRLRTPVVGRTTLALSLLTTLWTWAHKLSETGPYSAFTYSRHIAVTVLFITVVVTYVGWREEFE